MKHSAILGIVRHCNFLLLVWGGLLVPQMALGAITLLREKIESKVPDQQDLQITDRVHPGGWLGSRIMANATNRLARVEPDRLLEGYRKRPGRQIWDGEHLGKWMHAATLAWANTGDPELRRKLDIVSEELPKCQLADGYLGTYEETTRWTDWDIWAHKYNLLGLLTYIRHTGNEAPLEACKRMGDLLCKTFGENPGQRDILTAGQHMGMAPTSVLEPMVLLYRYTGEPRYLEFCKYILRSWERPRGPKIVSTLLTSGRVDKVGNAKAYEMLSCLNGALEYYRISGDRDLLQACLNAWKDIVDNRLYLTGTASYREFFHDDHDLPNVNNVGETCVTVTWLQFNAQLLRLTGEARFAEHLEKTVLNHLFGAQSPDGSSWGYYVQMEGRKPYSGTLDGHCCLSSGPRGVSLIPSFAVTTDADGVVVNLYEAGSADLKLRHGTTVGVVTRTTYPAGGEVSMKLSLPSAAKFAVKLRKPQWAPGFEASVNGKAAHPKADASGYIVLERQWRQGDEIQVRIKLEPRLVTGARNNEGRVAACFGPLVLAADEQLIASSGPIRALGVSGCKLEALHIEPGPAPKEFRTWPGARAFNINALFREVQSQKPTSAKLIPFADAGSRGGAYKIWLPCQEPDPKRNLLIDGVEIRSRKPNAGSIIDGSFETIAATFANKRAAVDWFGVELEEPIKISRVVFAHGKSFHDGGWFDASQGKPRIEIKTTKTGEWVTAFEIKKYPGTTALNPAGLKSGERFECVLPGPVEVFGVRVIGKPASGDKPLQAFASCAELQAYLE
jgi:DUF1680 family protein